MAQIWKGLALKGLAEELMEDSLADCDTRIKGYTDQIEGHERVLEMGELECVAYDADLLLEYQAFKESCKADIVILTTLRKAIQIEKQIYMSRNTKTKATMIPLFLSKFDEYLAEAYALMEESVQNGGSEENDYLHLCKESAEHRNFLKIVCDVLCL